MRIIYSSMAANLYNPTSLTNSSSSCSQEQDDISRFLQQIILRSSSSGNMRHQPFAALSDPGLGMGPGQISAPDPHSVLSSSNSGCGLTAGNVSSSAGKLDNEADDYDYDGIEAVVEAVVEETDQKATPSRSSSKRSRAAEVHNQSEKRRRSRINEKMKALQNLIPNSNKVVKATDKASMLDEAIEYLKQLQLQVQMLTMRNGLSLYPICVSGMLQQPNQHMMSQMRTEAYDQDNLSNVYTAESISMDPNISADPLIGLQDKCTEKGPVTDFSSTIAGSKCSLKLESESSMMDHFVDFRQSKSSQGICEEKVRPCQPPNDDCLQTAGAKAWETNLSELKEISVEAACLAGGDHLLQNFINHPIFSSSHLDM